MPFHDVLYEVIDGVATVAINRPSALNSMREQTIVELAQGIHQASDDRAVGVVVIRGVGGRAFSAGGDQKHLVPKMNSDSWRPVAREFLKLFEAIRRCPTPVIAAVQGWAIGGGNELATYCDLTIASESSRFGQVGPRTGSIPMFVTQTLPRAVGDKRAKEILFLCEQYDAHAAKDLGLVNFVVADADFEAEVDALCQKILEKSPTSLRILKMGVNYGQRLDESHTDMLIELSNGYFGTEEQLEGTIAFRDKREPDFRRFRRPTLGDV
jgi:dihydroxynaphthoic acid synthetase